MEYIIFKITSEGFLKSIAYQPFNNYLEAERVVKGLKKDYKTRKFTILTIYK